MTGTPRVPNQLLRELLTEAEWTGTAVAKAVNEVGAENGVRLHYDRTAVAHWLSGARPRPPVPDMVAEAFSRRLGRRVPVAETGLTRSTPDCLGPWWDQDIADQLGADVQHESGTVYSLAGLSVPSWAALVSARPAAALVRTGETGVGPLEIESAEAVLDVFSTSDSAFGGGHTQHAISAYLRSPMAGWLRSGARPALRRGLLTAAARLSYLCGFASFDAELHGVAQQYLLAALRLAGEASDRVHYAITLYALSVQAHHLGHPRHADDLANAAVRTAGTLPPRIRALLLGQLAVTSAARGDPRAAVEHLNAAESQLDRATGGDAVLVPYHLGSLNRQRAAVHAHSGERVAAIDALQQSLRHGPAAERRDRATTLARLAELQLDDGRLDQACQTWQRFLDDYPLLNSGRVEAALTTLRSRTRPYTHHPAAHAVNLRATRLAARDERLPRGATTHAQRNDR